MNLIKEFKEALLNVSEELKSNLNSKAKSDYKDLTVYLGPGSGKLLEKKNFQWSEIHDENMVIVNKVKVVDGALNALYSVNNHNFNKITKLEQEINNLPSLNTQVIELNNTCISLKESLISLEEDLAVFENQIEIDRFTKYSQNIDQIVSVHQSEWNIKVELLKRKLSKMRSKNLVSKEKEIQKHLTERQKTFDEAYQQDLKEYLEKGRLERHVSDPSPMLSKDDEDLTMDFESTDSQKLDDFLN